jgi:hypothetical protein
MSPALTLLVYSTMILGSVQVLAADFPKTGNAEYDTYYVFRRQDGQRRWKFSNHAYHWYHQERQGRRAVQ